MSGPRNTVLLTYADVVLDPCAHVVTRGRREVGLTRMEFRLLEALMLTPGRVLTRRLLLERVWGITHGRSSALDTTVSHMRAKLEAGGGSRLVHTVRGVGFVLRDQTAGGERS